MLGIVRYIQRRWRNLCRKVARRAAKWHADFRFSIRVKRCAHNLPARLIVSLTSYPARFPTLPSTLKCLMTQTVRPDRLILWIARQDKDSLTKEILELEKSGLEIHYCDDLRSYKKIIPTLLAEPEAFTVTADDDVYYWPTWLEELVSSCSQNSLEIVCHRAHRIQLDSQGLPLPYQCWATDEGGKMASPLNFPTGVGGVMYPPHIFHPDVLDRDVYERYCFHADDIWLYWMARRNGGVARKIGPKREFISWPGTQETALWMDNVEGGRNDEQIASMIRLFGFPKI